DTPAAPVPVQNQNLQQEQRPAAAQPMLYAGLSLGLESKWQPPPIPRSLSQSPVAQEREKRRRAKREAREALAKKRRQARREAREALAKKRRQDRKLRQEWGMDKRNWSFPGTSRFSRNTSGVVNVNLSELTAVDKALHAEEMVPKALLGAPEVVVLDDEGERGGDEAKVFVVTAFAAALCGGLEVMDNSLPWGIILQLDSDCPLVTPEAPDQCGFAVSTLMDAFARVPGVVELMAWAGAGTFVSKLNEIDVRLAQIFADLALDPSLRIEVALSHFKGLARLQFLVPCRGEHQRDFLLQRELYGSRWGFHGSPQVLWFSILRNGLRNMSGTKFQRHGSVRGSGVYMAGSWGTAWDFANKRWSPNEYATERGITCAWTRSSLCASKVVAVCEVARHARLGELESVLVAPEERFVRIAAVVVNFEPDSFGPFNGSVRHQGRDQVPRNALAEEALPPVAKRIFDVRTQHVKFRKAPSEATMKKLKELCPRQFEYQGSSPSSFGVDFVIRDLASGLVFVVVIGQFPSCSCSGNLVSHEVCEHILAVHLVVLKFSSSNPIIWQKELWPRDYQRVGERLAEFSLGRALIIPK
ncbi:Protein mono-ADP-ribosyltransferase PARP6 (ADP-ribosyltransferase diphtheria toxin-like 17) (ARTD17) (Poly [ADP-ribose] polymerase 6) (PARP-6), partial [Durusdinium trenchii]